MNLGPRGKKIYFLVIVVVFGGAILAMSMIYGRSPFASSAPAHVRAPFGAATQAYFERAVYRPSQMLFADNMTYYIAPPQGAMGGGRLYPVLVILPDENGAAPAARYLLQTQLAAFYPAFIIVPVIPEGERWAVAGAANIRFGAARHRRIDLAMDLLRTVLPQIPADPSRVYMLGCGNGATGVLRAVEKNDGLFTAAAAVAGRWPIDQAAALVKTPLWIIQGQYDRQTPARYMQNLVAHIRRAGGDARFTQVPKMSDNCHDPRLYMNAMWSWLFAQQVKSQLPPLPPSVVPLQDEPAAQ